MNWVRAVVSIVSHFAVVGAANCLAFLGAGRLAEVLCRRAAVWLADSDLIIQVAFIRSRAGDLEGALDCLDQFQSPLPQHKWQLLRAIYSGMFCENNHRADRAVSFFEAATTHPAIPDDTKGALQARIRRLRPVYKGVARGA